MSELKGCPFCGGKARVWNHGYYQWYGKCDECQAETCHYDNPYSAANAWNRRAPESLSHPQALSLDEKVAPILWCDYQEQDDEGIYCTAHVAEARIFNCPYKDIEVRRNAKYPCSDYRKPKEDA